MSNEMSASAYLGDFHSYLRLTSVSGETLLRFTRHDKRSRSFIVNLTAVATRSGSGGAAKQETVNLTLSLEIDTASLEKPPVEDTELLAWLRPPSSLAPSLEPSGEDNATVLDTGNREFDRGDAQQQDTDGREQSERRVSAPNKSPKHAVPAANKPNDG